MDIKYISDGSGAAFLYGVVNGYAFRLSADNTMILCSKTDLPDGVYDENGKADDVITNVVMNKLNRPVEFYNNISIIKVIENFIIKIKDIGLKQMLPITGAPKLTKALADGLDKILEPMAFVEEDGKLQYLCVGARSRIEKLFPDSIFISTMRYYSATLFKGSVFGRKTKYCLIIVDENLEHIGIIFKINLEERDKYVKDTNG